MTDIPVLYSFRRCPYAIRARMALAATAITVELREVLLRDKPPELIAVSPKATVPVLVLRNGTVLEESLEIMLWALEQHDPFHWSNAHDQWSYWVTRCDGEFKHWLDRYKYADRYPEHSAEHYRASAEPFLQRLESALTDAQWITGAQPALADVALFPFIRQFAAVDAAWWETAPYPMAQRWLNHWLKSSLFQVVMSKFPRWQPGAPAEHFPPKVAAAP